MKFFYRILWMLFGEELIAGRDLDREAMRNWLFDGFGGKGFRTYYTIRKKAIERQLGYGLESNNYWEMVGRIKELKHLSKEIDGEGKSRNKIRKVK